MDMTGNSLASLSNIASLMQQSNHGPVGEVYDTLVPSVPMSVRNANQLLTVLRSGARVDRTVPDYLACSVGRGLVVADGNQPLTIGERQPSDWIDDSDITRMGELMSTQLGHVMNVRGLRPTLIYVSPALRCVRTAQALIAGAYGSDELPKICIEPGLFDCTSWYAPMMPSFVPPKELRTKWHFNVNDDYRPMFSTDKLQDMSLHETPLETYKRLTRVLVSISQHHNDGEHKEHIVVVTHAMGVDAAARWMTRQPLTSAANRSADNVGLYYPYLANVSGVVGAPTNETSKYMRAPLLVDGLLPEWHSTGAHNHADTQYIARAAEQTHRDQDA